MVNTVQVLCDCCGIRMRVHQRNADDVNYCSDCCPVTEDPEPDEEDGHSETSDNGIEID